MMLVVNKNKSSLLQQLFALLFSVTLVTINILRIVKVPITIDENGYDPYESYAELWQSARGHANNHMLHSIIRKFLVEHFSGDIIFYRLDSLFAQILFLVTTYLICRFLLKDVFWLLLGFCFLNLISPLIFQFWGLSRGYALSLAFMVLSIYCLLIYLRNNKLSLLCLAYITAILSVYSNFGYLNYFCSLAAVVLLHNFIFKKPDRRKNLIKELLITAVAAGVLAAIIKRPLINVWENGEIMYMGRNGFMEDTIKSLVRDGLFISNITAVNILSWVVAAIVFGEGIYWLYTYFKKQFQDEPKKSAFKTGILFYLLLTVPAISMIAQHKIFQINYLTDRTALFFIILFSLNLVYWLYYIKPSFPKISWGALLFIFVAAVYNYAANLNLVSTYLWWFDAEDVHVISRIANETKNKNRKIKVGVSWMFVPSFNYDFEQKFPGMFYPVKNLTDTAGKDTTFDYYYITPSEVSDRINVYYSADTTYMFGGYILYRKKGLLH